MSRIIDLIGRGKFDEIDYSKNYGANSIVITAIDSIFSIQAKYKSTVKPLLKRFATFVGMKDLDNDQYTPEDFINRFSGHTFDDLAINVFKNRQRTSSRSGVLKAEALYYVLEMLNKNNIQTRQDLINCKNIEQIEDEWRSVHGQSSGITWRYFLMGVGFTDHFKDDSWIYRFFIDKLGYKNIRKGGDYNNLKLAFEKEYNLVRSFYPNITVTKLDHLIWEYMENGAKKSAKC